MRGIPKLSAVGLAMATGLSAIPLVAGAMGDEPKVTRHETKQWRLVRSSEMRAEAPPSVGAPEAQASPEPDTGYQMDQPSLEPEADPGAQAELDVDEPSLPEAQAELDIDEPSLPEAQAEPSLPPEGEEATGESMEVAEAAPMPIIHQVLVFEPGSAELNDASREALDSVAEVFEGEPQRASLQIEGHTDATGSAESNTELAQRRAESVREYLEEKGLSSAEFQTDARGEDDPIASNDTADGRAMNRRVELKTADR